MKPLVGAIVVLFFLESCMNEARCNEDCNRDFSICLLVAGGGPNALGFALICQNSCTNCKEKCRYIGSGGSTSRSRTSSSGGGGGSGGGSGGGDGGGGHGGGGHGGGGIIRL
ncbi:hypothetical protein [Leptospira wolffii]|uniref:hypothetical protein n=1 Tax=Leptospira wolffii TaxID=409998 RepID=UPI000318F2C0|nr:hypothetical protein [Leptospira wolffii]EPG64493.1 hypothetical protein LEP1GSC061_3508 [Leptospira wolffii serovar Khorat str. Khorat-H2]